jgi:hypothetical protein
MRVCLCVYDRERQKDTDGRTHNDTHARPATCESTALLRTTPTPTLSLLSQPLSLSHRRTHDTPARPTSPRTCACYAEDTKTEALTRARQSEAERTLKLRVLLLLLAHSFLVLLLHSCFVLLAHSFHLRLLLRLRETAPASLSHIYIYRQCIYTYIYKHTHTHTHI